MRQWLISATGIMMFLIVQASAQTNLALNKQATSSSVQTGNSAANAVDGNTGTRWCAVDGSAPQWLEVDLGTLCAITSCEVMWEKNAVYKYKVETSSDNVIWNLGLDKTANTSSQQTFTDGYNASTNIARYVRITATGIPSGCWASIFEFRVYGSTNVPPSITTQPANQTINLGQTATFSVVAAGPSPITYQWLKNGITIGGAMGSSYTTPAVTKMDSGSIFSCSVSNYYGTTSTTSAILSVKGTCTIPSIQLQPVGQTVTAGQPATFTVVASGDATLNYQWQNGGVNISGATSARYTIPATAITDNGSTFSCYISNSCGYVTSTPVLLVVTPRLPAWTGTSDGLLYADPLTTKVGIGTSSPTATLQVQSDNAVVKVTDNQASNQNSVYISPTQIKLSRVFDTPYPSTTIGQGDISLSFGNGLSVSGMGTYSEVREGWIKAYIPGSGSTTIDAGTITVQGTGASPKQSIIGGGYIKTDSLYVGTNGWSITAPDYVFAKDYNLMPLSKLEAFINENGHLPEIPSAQDMEKQKSVNLVEMNMKLLKKIEELTLHSIEQEKRIEELEKIVTKK